MVSLRVNDEFLDYAHESTFGMIYRTSIFEINESRGNRSFSISLPFTSKNDRLLGFSRLVKTPKAVRTYECEMLFNGASLHSGSLVIFNISENYECYFYPNTTQLEILETPINELELLDEDVDLGTTSADVVSVAHADNSDDGYGWPSVEMQDFYDEALTYPNPFKGIINPRNAGHVDGCVNYVSGPTTYNKYTYAPSLFLDWILKKVCASIGLRPIGDLLTDDQFKKFVAFSNKAIDLASGVDYHGLGDCAGNNTEGYEPLQPEWSVIEGGSYMSTATYVPASLDPDEYTSPPTNDYSRYRCQADGTHRVTLSDIMLLANDQNPHGFGKSNLQTVSVELIRYIDATAETVIAHVWENTAVRMDAEKKSVQTFDVWEPHDLELGVNDYIYFRIYMKMYFIDADLEVNTGTTCKKLKVDIKNISTSDLNIYAKSFNKKDIAPTITIREFLLTLKQWFGIIITMNPMTKSIQFSLLRNILLFAQPDDWSNKSVSKPQIDLTKNKNFKWAFKDEQLSKLEYSINSNTPGVETVTITPLMQTFDAKLDVSIPALWELDGRVFKGYGTGYSEMFGVDTKQELRFLPTTRADGDTAETGVDKQATNKNSYTSYFWKEAAEILANADEVVIPLQLTAAEIQKLDFTRKKMIDGTEYLLTELRVPLLPGRIGVCVATLLRIR